MSDHTPWEPEVTRESDGSAWLFREYHEIWLQVDFVFRSLRDIFPGFFFMHAASERGEQWVEEHYPLTAPRVYYIVPGLMDGQLDGLRQNLMVHGLTFLAPKDIPTLVKVLAPEDIPTFDRISGELHAAGLVLASE